MIPAAWIYFMQFELWSPQLHQHLYPHLTHHLNNITYPLTPDLHWHQYLHLCDLFWLLDSSNLYKWMTSSLWTCYPYTTTLQCSVLQCFDAGWAMGIWPVKKLCGWMLAWLFVWGEVQICIWPRWCHCHSLTPGNPDWFWFYLSGPGSIRRSQTKSREL